MRSKTTTAPSALQGSLQDITSALSPTTPGHPAELTTGAEALTHPAPRRVRRGWLVRRMLFAADMVGLLVAFSTTELIFLGDEPPGGTDLAFRWVVFLLLLPLWAVIAKLYGLYDRDEARATHTTADEVVSVFHLITVGLWLFFATSWLVGLTHPNQAKLATFWLLALVCVAGLRSVARGLARRNPAYVQNAVIVGAGDVGQLIGRKLLHHPEYRINLLGFVDATPKEMRGDLESTELLGEPDEIGEIVRRADVDRVIVAFSRDDHEEMHWAASGLIQRASRGRRPWRSTPRDRGPAPTRLGSCADVALDPPPEAFARPRRRPHLARALRPSDASDRDPRPA